MSDLEWYEYDKAEEQLEVLNNRLAEARVDLETLELSVFSRNAILNEVQRFQNYASDVQELIDGVSTDDPYDSDLNEL